VFSCPAGASGTTANAVVFIGTSNNPNWVGYNPFSIDK
jgi:hypothetical protein